LLDTISTPDGASLYKPRVTMSSHPRKLKETGSNCRPKWLWNRKQTV